MVVFDALSSVILKVHFCDHVITCGVYRGFIDLSFEKKVAINKKSWFYYNFSFWLFDFYFRCNMKKVQKYKKRACFI